MTLQKLIGTSVSQVPTNGMLGTLAFINAANAAFPAPVSFALGSAASPSLYFTGDVNTGIYSPGADQLAVSTGGTGRLFVDSSGRLLVGTSTARSVSNFGSSAGKNIQVETSELACYSAVSHYNAFPAGPIFAFGRSRSGATPGVTIVQNGDTLGDIRFCGADGVDFESLGARIHAEVDGTPGADDMPGRLVFSTTVDGAASPTERLRITSAGNVGIGTTAPATRLDVVGSLTVRAAAAQDGIILAGRAGGSGTFDVTISPTTLTADRTLTLADSNTTLQGGTMAITGGTLAQFAATTSAELAGVISDETGSGALVFATSPTFVTPVLGVATGTSFNSITGLSSTNPAALGAVAVGTGTTTARADHVHPTTGLGLTSGTLAQFAATTSSQLAGVISDETGSGALVFATSPSLTTPAIGAATGTSLVATGAAGLLTRAAATQDGVEIIGRAGGTTSLKATITPTTLTASRTITLPDLTGTVALSANNLSFFAATTSAQLAGVISDETGSGALVFATSPTLVTPVLGTPSSGNLSNCTNVPAGQLSGTIPSGVLGASSLFIGTTSVALNRGTGVLALTGMGTITPNADNTSDLGSGSLRWANVYTGDLHLKNDRGDYTIIEEEDALTLRNNKTGKIYNFVLQERA